MSPAELPATAAVLGAGPIGLSAAILLAAHGVPVTLVTRCDQAAAAAPEAVDLRLSELTELGAFTADGVLATTTSSLPLAELASALTIPERFAGWHFFHPADLMALVEIVPGERTEPAVLARLRAWSEQLGRRPIVLRRDVPGFVANRLRYALLREAYALTEAAVCGFGDVDVAVTAGLGARWGGTPARVRELESRRDETLIALRDRG